MFRSPNDAETMQSNSNIRPAPDTLLVDIADYVLETTIGSEEAFDTARHCLMDSLGCAIAALEFPACTRLLGPIVPGTIVPDGAGCPELLTSWIPCRPLSTWAP
jgi:2-methylcitrate dehydratase